MRPSEFMRQYRSLVVKLDDGSLVTADVHQYMINIASNARVANAKAMWDKISGAMNDEVAAAKKAAAEWLKERRIGPAPPASREWLLARIDPSITYGLLAAVQYGKGSPAANKVFLALAVRYGFADRNKLVDFTDKYMGLDCSGFVSNYLVEERLLAGPDVVNRNANSYDVAGNRRAKLDEVRQFDLMVWTDTNHIAVIDTAPVAVKTLAYPKPIHGKTALGPPESVISGYTCDAVESNGSRGLDVEQYTIQSVDAHCIFTVKRASGTTWHVHVINAGVTA